jgi:hypothetical protein
MSTPKVESLTHLPLATLQYARVDLNPIPEVTLFPSQGLRILPLLFSVTLTVEIVAKCLQ